MKGESSRVAVKRASFCYFKVIGKILILALLVCLLAGIFAACDEEKKLILVYGNGEEDGVYDEETYSDPTREGYVFKGWYLQPNGNIQIELSEFIKDDWEGEIKVYAHWQALPELTGIIVNNTTVVWDGALHGVEVENVPIGAVVYSQKYSDAGTYVVTVTVKKEGYTTFSQDALLTISKAEIPREDIPVCDAQFVYDGEEHSIEVGELPTGIVSYSAQNNGRTAVGEQQVTFSFEVDKNHEQVDDIVVTLRIYKEEYTVTYVQENGERLERKVERGGSVTDVPAVTPKVGYEGRWTSEAVDVQNDMEIRAVYDIINYSVVYKDADGEVYRQTYNVEAAELELYMPEERRGYDFVSWYEDGQEVKSLSPDMARNVELTGEWTAIVYTVRYNLNGGTNVTTNLDPTEQVYTYTIESDTKILAPAVRDGYDFVRWEDENGQEVSKIEKGEIGDRALSAIWKPVEYTLTYDYGYDDKTEEVKYNLETPAFELKIPEQRQQYRFVGWKIEGVKYTQFVPLDWRKDVTATAQWEEIIVKVTVNFYDGDSLIVSRQYRVGEALSYAPDPKDGYEFKRWKDGNDATVTFAAEEDMDVYAEWDIIEYKIEYYDGAQKVHVDVFTVETVEMPEFFEIEPKDGYEFLYWEDAHDDRVFALEKVLHDIYLYARWAPVVYNITYIIDGQEEHKDTFTVEAPMPALFYPAQRQGYAFDGWYENGVKVEALTMKFEDIVLQAHFEAIIYSILYMDGDSEVFRQTYTVETDPMPELYDYAPQKTGYKFICWQDEKGQKVEKIDRSFSDVTLYARLELIEYYIVYKDGENEVHRDAYTVETEHMPSMYEPSARNGYTFNGWYEGSLKVDSLTNEARDIELEAKWSPIEYKIVYHDADTQILKEDKFTIESEMPELYSPTKTGYKFLHWQDGPDNEVKSLQKVCHDIHLYACWELVVYNIIYKDGENQVGEPQTFTVETEQMPSLLVPDERRGYTFDGWYEGDVKITQLVKKCEDIILQGKWTAIEYTVTYVDGESVVYTQNFTADESMPSLFVPESRQGYNFEGWYENGEKVTELKMEYRNIFLEAHWQLITYTITYFDKDDVQMGEPQTYTALTEMPVLRRPEEMLGYKFEGWFIKGEDGVLGDKVEVLTKTYQNIVLKGKWSLIEYKITYVDGDAVQVDTYTVESGTPPMHMPEAKRGYEFAGWYEGDVRVEEIKEEYRDVRLEAHWRLITYKISYMDGDMEIFSDSYDDETDPMPSLYTPDPKDGYSFDGWFVGEDKIEALEKTYENIVLTGKWTAIVYYIYYYDDESLVHTDDFTAENEMPSLFVPADKQGYSFESWLDTNNEKVDQLTLRYENITLHASWKEVVYNVVYYDGDEIVHTDTYTISTSQMPPIYKLDDKEGFTFVGWFDGDDVEVREIVKEFKDVALYAKWKANEEEGHGSELKFLYEDVDGGVRITGLEIPSAKVTIPATLDGKAVVDIASGALTSEIISLEIAANIQIIRKDMLALCVNMTELILPAAAIELEEFLLDGLDKLEKLTVPFVGLKEYHEGDYTSNGSNLANLFGEEPRDGLYEVECYKIEFIDNGEQDSYKGPRYAPQSLKYVKVLRGGLSAYGLSMFASLEEIDITGASLGVAAMKNCVSLKKLTLRGVTSIEASALYNASNVTDIYLVDCDCKEALNAAVTKAKANAQIHEQSENA